MRDELDKIYSIKDEGTSKTFKTISEGTWKLFKGLANWVGLGDAIDRWSSQSLDDKYQFSKVLSELEKKLQEKAVIAPHDYTAHYNKIAEFQNALYNVGGDAARRFANIANNLTKKVEAQIKEDGIRDQVRANQVNQGLDTISRARQTLASGDVYTKEKMRDLVKEAETTLNSIQ